MPTDKQIYCRLASCLVPALPGLGASHILTATASLSCSREPSGHDLVEVASAAGYWCVHTFGLTAPAACAGIVLAPSEAVTVAR